MYLLRTEWEKIWTVEKKVDHLEDSVSQIQNSLSNPNKGQDSTNNKLDDLLKLIKKLPSSAELSDTIDKDQHEDRNPPPRQKREE